MPNPIHHIVMAGSFEPIAVHKAQTIGRVTELGERDEAGLAAHIRDADALLVRTHARVTRKLLECAPRLRVIGRAGTGLDNIDLPAAQERGIIVVYTPAAATEAVADLTVGMMISLIRRLHTADQLTRSGRFDEAREQSVGSELSTLTLGIVGMGRIGQALGRRCQLGFNMTVLFNDIVDVGPLGFTATPVEKDRLYAQSDVISLHVPLTDLTRRMIGADDLARFKPGAILINTSRGAVVDSEALARALTCGALGGAALDVFDPEPLPSGHPLLGAPHTLLTPHIGARTPGSLSSMNSVIDDVISVLEGRPPRFPATPDDV